MRPPRSGYLQFVRCDTLVDHRRPHNAVIRLLHRPGHFLSRANRWPGLAAAAAPACPARSARPRHRPYRTLAQDLTFAVDQLVEIAIRALSPAVNDTFTALACVDWLGDGLCKIAERGAGSRSTRRRGHVRVIAAASATGAWSSAPTRRSARPAAGCRR